MARKQPLFYEELTDEGIEIWNRISEDTENSKKRKEVPSITTKPEPIKLDLFKVEVYHLRLQLRKMIRNSEMVIDDMDKILSKIETAEDYIKTEVKTVKLLHQNNIKRLTKILDGEEAFDKPIEVAEEPKRPYEESSKITVQGELLSKEENLRRNGWKRY